MTSSCMSSLASTTGVTRMTNLSTSTLDERYKNREYDGCDEDGEHGAYD